MDDDPLEIGDRLVVIVLRLHGLRRIGTEHVVDVAGDVLEFDVGDRECADVAAGTGEGHPGRRGGLAALIEHLRQPVGHQSVQ